MNPTTSPGRSRGVPVFVCGVRPCVIVVRDSVTRHAPVNPQHFGSRHNYWPEQVLCGVCMWKVLCGGNREALEDVNGLRVAGVVLLWGPWGEAWTQGACWVRHCQVSFGCM